MKHVVGSNENSSEEGEIGLNVFRNIVVVGVKSKNVGNERA